MLILYMVKGLLIVEHQAYGIYGALLAFAFLSPTIGGVLASHFLNASQVLRIGSLLGVVGSLLLFSANMDVYFSGFGILVLGSGFLRSVIPSMLGTISGDKKDSNFTSLYVFYNLGTLLGVIICAGVGETFGWRWSFISSGFAMVIACLLIFLRGAYEADEGRKGLGVFWKFIYVIAGIMLGASLGLFSLHFNKVADVVIPLLTLTGIICFLFIAKKKLSAKSLSLFSVLMIAQIAFFALYEQVSLSLTMFIDVHVERATDLFRIPTTIFQAVDPLLNVVSGSFIALIGDKLFTGDRFWRPLLKNCFGFVVSALVFLSLYFRTIIFPNEPVGIHLIIACMTLFVVAEVLIVPTGFATLAEHTPDELRPKLMGLWLSSIGGAMWLAGQISKISAPSLGLAESKMESLERFSFTFKILGFFSGGFAIALLLVLFIIGRRSSNQLVSEVGNDVQMV